MKRKLIGWILALVALIAILIVVSGSVFVVHPDEYGVVKKGIELRYKFVLI